MDLKRLFKDNYAVSPVIGVILMVAITVILAAAIGSSVFDQGPEEPLSYREINIEPVSFSNNGTASVKLEMNSGNPIDFGNNTAKITASLENSASVDIYEKGLGIMEAGDVKILDLVKKEDTSENAFEELENGNKINIKIIDVKTNRLICDKNIKL